MAYEAKDFGKLLGMGGFSDILLNNHFTLYKGYVTNSNKVMDTLAALLKDSKTATPEYSELKRRLGWEFDGMRLHEYYFENLGGKAPLALDSKLAKLLASNFGSYDIWLQDFKATASMRGIGWTILYQDFHSGKVFNQWINEHDVGHLTGC
jgi:superoxide dismutase, Fe-Mn family